MSPIPIVVAAFGTTTKAITTYSCIEARVRAAFPDHPLYWAFTSRMVRARVGSGKRQAYPSPNQVLAELAAAGHAWTVLQSLHVLCGHEFERLVTEAGAGPVRTSIGLPLLDSVQDYTDVLTALGRDLGPCAEDEALILIGHGTDHAIWAAYPALEYMARQVLGPHVFVGVVEGCPGPGEVARCVVQAGFRRVCLMPFLLVAGVHFEQDVCGSQDSWRVAFEAHGIRVRYVGKGLGEYASIGDIFCRHIREALEVIPDRA